MRFQRKFNKGKDASGSLPLSVNDRMISLFCEDFFFTYAKFSENKTLVKIPEFTVVHALRKQNNQFCITQRDDCRTRTETKNYTIKQEPSTIVQD